MEAHFSIDLAILIGKSTDIPWVLQWKTLMKLGLFTILILGAIVPYQHSSYSQCAMQVRAVISGG